MIDLNNWKSVEQDDLFQAIAAEDNRRFVLQTLKSLTVDPVWTDYIIQMVESAKIETRCFISWLARELKPKAYLEVGVRRGFSMAMVAAQCPETEIFGFDLWLPSYAGVANPGPKFVQAEMEKVGFSKKVNFIKGNSGKTLPAFFKNGNASLRDRMKIDMKFRRRPKEFDMLLVDGDHSLIGAYHDLLNTFPHCAIGGAVIFDDIAPDLNKSKPEEIERERGEDPYGWGNLLGVWHAVQKQFPQFRYFEYTQTPPGVGLAIRLS